MSKFPVSRFIYFLVFIFYPFSICFLSLKINANMADILILFGILMIILSNRKIFFPFDFFLLIFVFSLVLLISGFLSNIFYLLGHFNINVDLKYSLICFLKVLTCFIWFWYFVLICQRLSLFSIYKGFEVSLMICMFLIFYSVIYELIVQNVRAKAFFNNPNLYSDYLLFNLAILFSRLSFQKSNQFVFKVLLFLIPLGVFSTGSRSGILGCLLFFFLYYLATSSNIFFFFRKFVFICIFIFLIIISIVKMLVWQGVDLLLLKRLMLTLHASEGYIPGVPLRGELWSEALKEIFSSSISLIMGLGKRYVFLSDWGEFMEVHNTYLTILLQSGIVGITIYLLVIFLILKKSLTLTRKYRYNYYLLLPFYFFVMLNLLEGMVENTDHFRTLWMTLGIIYALSRKYRF